MFVCVVSRCVGAQNKVTYINIRAPVLLNLLNALRKSIKLVFSTTRLINSITYEHECKILYILIMESYPGFHVFIGCI